MPGPRKNLTPLDMKMMGLAFNQGGIINFLGQQPEVTAPVRAQSHADSPPVQLAYITDAEKDLLVKSNIHGSMDGKPNPGPAGIESLDDFFTTPGGGIAGGSGQQVFSSGVDSGQQSTGNEPGGGGYQSSEAYGIQPGMAVSDSGQVFVSPLSAGPGENQINQFVPVSDEQQEKLKTLALAKLGADKAQEQQDTLLGKIFSKNELQQFTPSKLNTIQTELNKFIELGIRNPFKLRGLMLNNIGGFLSGTDQTYSDMQGNIVEKKDALDEEGKLKEGIRYTREGMEDLVKERFGSNVFESLKRYAPDIGYTALGGYMPQTSGGLETLGKQAALKKNQDGKYITADGRIVPKEQAEKYNKMIFDARSLGSDRDGSGGQTINYTSSKPYMPVGPDPVVSDPVVSDPVVPLPGITPPMTGIPSLAPTGLNYASMAPQFGPQYPGYLNQGVMDPNFAQYYQNLSDYYGYNI